MDKIFLSHSSADKNYVEKVVETLGHFKCVYDTYTFELGMPTMDEILKNLDDTDIFVYFISDNSLESEWVKTELKEAYGRLMNSNQRLFKIFPIIIDDNINHEDNRIADFLKKNYNLRIIK